MTAPDFRSLFESAPGCYLVLAPDFTVVAVSDAYLKATGTQREQILKRGLLELAPGNPEFRPLAEYHDLKASLLRVLEGGTVETMQALRVELRRPDGSVEIRHWSRVNSPVLDDQSKVAYVIHSIEDISDLVRIREESETSVRELESFSYSISHDLRAPLRAIQGYSRILAEEHAGALSAEGRRVAGVITDSAVRLSGLIDGVLEFSRLGRKEMKFATVDMTALAREVLDELLAQAPDRKIEAKLATLPPASGDRLLLRQVWANLIGNAVKYTAKLALAHIEIGGSPGPDLNTYWVKDDGVGFSMEYAPKLFGVFQRLHSPKEFPGIGVGLALVHRIIVRHGGKITAEGAPNQGARFTFTLPVATATERTV